MNLKKLFEMQKVLDDRIVKEKGLEGADLLPMKILALQTELGECANEWRGFKFWSKNQKPRTLHTTAKANEENAAYKTCGNCSFTFTFEDDGFYDNDDCPECDHAMFYFKEEYPLLEEYVDGLHFILSIGNGIGYKADKYAFDRNVQVFKSPYGSVEQFSDVFEKISDFRDDLRFMRSNDEHEAYEELLYTFSALGELLGFTQGQIEQAYLDKNAVNHTRQDNSY